MNWISIKDKKPSHDIFCVVFNNKGWMDKQFAYYDKSADVWKFTTDNFRHTLLLEITHYLEIPETPNREY